MQAQSEMKKFDYTFCGRYLKVIEAKRQKVFN